MVDVVHALPIPFAVVPTLLDTDYDPDATPLPGPPIAHHRSPRAIFTIHNTSADSLLLDDAPPEHPHAPLMAPAVPDDHDARPSRENLTDDQRRRRLHSDARRYHALLELLDTERDYLNDLRTLADVYLASLPSLVAPPSRSRSMPSVAAVPKTLSAVGPAMSFPLARPAKRASMVVESQEPNYAASDAPICAPPSHPQERQPQTSSPTSSTFPTPLYGSAKNSHPPPPSFNFKFPRASSQQQLQLYPNGSQDYHQLPKASAHNAHSLLTPQQTAILARNTFALLDLHTSFLTSLENALHRVGFLPDGQLAYNDEASPDTMGPSNDTADYDFRRGNLEKTDAAVDAACQVIDECAPAFEMYANFCVGHTDALDLARKLKELHPGAWDAWEKACARRVWERSERCRQDELERHNRRRSVSSHRADDDVQMLDDASMMVTDEPEQLVESPAETASPSDFPESAQEGNALSSQPFPTTLNSESVMDVTEERTARRKSASTLSLTRKRLSISLDLEMTTADAEADGSSPHRRCKSSSNYPSDRQAVRRSQTLDSPYAAKSPIDAQSDPGHGQLSLRSTDHSSHPMPSPSSLRIRSKSFGQALHLRTLKKQPSESAEADKKLDNERSKLMFADYLIKPVQRICKYPLLLEQLKRDQVTLPTDSDGEVIMQVLPRTLGTLRELLAKIDEAQMQADMERRSMTVAHRLIAGCSTPTFISAHPSPSVQSGLSRKFLEEELGHCILAGALDVIEWIDRQDSAEFSSSNGTQLKARYLAVFLYAGCFVILAKPHWVKHKANKNARAVAKAEKEKDWDGIVLGEVGGYESYAPHEGKDRKSMKLVYEPRQWFALPKEAFEVIDGSDTEAPSLMPHSIRLSSGRVAHRFELAASCAREKDIWLQALRDAKTGSQIPAWWDDAPSSLSSPASATLQRNFAHPEPNQNASDETGVPSSSMNLAVAMDLPSYSSNSTLKADNSTIRPRPQVLPSRGSSFSSNTPSERSGASVSRHASDSAPTSVATSASTSPYIDTRPALPPLPPTPLSAGSSIASPLDDLHFLNLVLIRRPTATRRAHVDRMLHGIYSETCLAARAHAQAREETLWPDAIPRPTGSARLRLGSADSDFGSLPTSTTAQLLTRAKTMAFKMNNRLSLRAKPTLSTLFNELDINVEEPNQPDDDMPLLPVPVPGPSRTDHSADSVQVAQLSKDKDSLQPEPVSAQSQSGAGEMISRSSSVSTSHGQSDAVASPLPEEFPPTVRVVGVDASELAASADGQGGAGDQDNFIPIVPVEDRPKRTRSLVDNMRGFFLMPRWSSSVSSLATRSGSPLEDVGQDGNSIITQNSTAQPHEFGLRPRRTLSKFWNTASLRKRVRSEPDVPKTAQSIREEFRQRSGLDGVHGHTLSPTLLMEPPSTDQPSPSVTLTRPSSSSAIVLLGRKKRSREEVLAPETADPQEPPTHRPEPPHNSMLGTGRQSLRRAFKHRLFLHNVNPLTPVASE